MTENGDRFFARNAHRNPEQRFLEKSSFVRTFVGKQFRRNGKLVIEGASQFSEKVARLAFLFPFARDIFRAILCKGRDSYLSSAELHRNFELKRQSSLAVERASSNEETTFIFRYY